MKVVGIIPARYGSSRLPGKPLKDICGKPMIWWVYQRVKEIKEFAEIYVATDDDRIVEECNKWNIKTIMTDSHHPTGANRLQEVSETVEADFYVQINGDEPLIDCDAVRKVVPEIVPMDRPFGTNIITKIKDPSLVMDPSNIKMVFDNDMNAMYMSRTPIPYPFKSIDFTYYKHVGIIGYNKLMLDFYKKSVPGRFELIEGIDTLRFLDYGFQLQLIEVDEYSSLSVDTEKDLEYVRNLMSRETI